MDLVEFIGKVFEASGVRDREVPLHQARKLGTKDDGTCGLIVVEERVELRPDVQGGARRCAYIVCVRYVCSWQ